MSLLLSLAALGAIGLAGTAMAAPDRSGQGKGALEIWQKIGAAYDQGDCATVLKLVVPRLKPSGSSSVPDKIRATGYDLAASCASKTNKDDLAYRYALEGTALEDSSDWLWRFRLAIELQNDRFEPGLTTIEAMTQGRGAALNAVPIQWMHQVLVKLKAQHRDDLRRKLLKLLTTSYRPDNPFASIDRFRQDYAEILYDAGDKAGAEALIHDIDTARVVNELSFDPRFRPMLAADFDVRAGVERNLAKARDLMRQHPDQLEPIVRVAEDLRQLGRPQEALEALDAARSSIAQTGAFSDRDEQLNWWWNGVASTQAMLGHYGEAMAAMRSGADVKEQGELNVSQVINLAEAQIHFGKPQEALATLAVFDGPPRALSPYGEMEMRFTRGCANALAGRKDALAADLAFARAHETDHGEALSDLLLCSGDLDGAAAAFIRRLEDPDRRVEALLQLSDYDAPPVALPDPVYAHMPALKARADMQAAIARAGGTRRIHLQRDEL
jgi:tetratricopeptide (TPR) repeat protein